MAELTFQYPAKATQGGYARLNTTLLDLGLLYNALITHRRHVGRDLRGWDYLRVQNAHHTDLHRHNPAYNQYARTLLESTARRFKNAFSRAIGGRGGFPGTKGPYLNDTLEVSEPRVKHLQLSLDGERGYVHIKGMPILTFRPDDRLPQKHSHGSSK